VFFSITSTITMGSVAGYAFLKSRGLTDDAKKIQRIFENSNLQIKEGGKKKTIRIYRKRKIQGGMEYIYQLPLGMSFQQIKEHKHYIEDGLNVKNALPIINVSDLMRIDWRKKPFQQITKIANQKQKAKKEVDLEFDGMLKVRVYEDGLADKFEWLPEIVKPNYVIPIGITYKGVIYHDFEEEYNLLIGGAAGYGKSTLLINIICSLIVSEPDHVKFTLIDLKDGVTFKKFSVCKQSKRFAKNPQEALIALNEIQNEMNSTYERLFKASVDNVSKLGIKEREFIIIDEAADISDDKDCMEILKDITRRGRAAGYRIIYATQYPTSETIPSQVKRNIISKVSFVLDTDVASRSVLDEGGAEELPLIKGRGIYKKVRKQIIQVPFISDERADECIAPFINIRPRKDDESESSSSEKDGKRGADSLIISETRLS
jgi:hypothetical protein